MSPSSKGTDEAVNDALLEKLRNCVSKPQEVDTFRNIAAKIHARVTSTGNQRSYLFLLFLFYIYIYDSVFHTTTIVFEEFHFSTQFSTEGLTDWQSRYVKNIKKKKKMLLVTVSLFIFVSETDSRLEYRQQSF